MEILATFSSIIISIIICLLYLLFFTKFNFEIHIIFAEPITRIVGSPDLYINTGSTVNLTCIVENLPEPPPMITWHHNSQVSIFLHVN